MPRRRNSAAERPAILERPVRVDIQLYRARAAERLSVANEGGLRAVATGNEANSMDASDAARASLSAYPAPSRLAARATTPARSLVRRN